MSHGVRGVAWCICILLVVGVTAGVIAQQATTSDADLVRQGPLALAAAHGDKPRYGGKFQTPPDLVVDHWTSDVESSSPLDFRLLHAMWTPFGCLMSYKIRPIISVVCDFATKSGGI